MEHAFLCPQCNAPLAPHRFAKSVVCSYCGATVQLDESSVSTQKFRDSFRIWNSPLTYQISSWLSIGDNHWVLGRNIAHGDISEVYAGQRARLPTELVIVKILRDRKDAARFVNEWEILQALQRSDAPGADTFSALLPQPVMHGEITNGAHNGMPASLYRWASGFRYTFEEVCQAYPHGVPPRASIWIWRRILEVLSFIHHSGMAHGAVLPSHLIVQENEHGVRLVGYGAAGHLGEGLRAVSPRFKAFYPASSRSKLVLSGQLDLVMSARCVVAILGGDLKTGSLPKNVPARLAGLLKQFAFEKPPSRSAWEIREELGKIADEAFGPPQFIPILMPA